MSTEPQPAPRPATNIMLDLETWGDAVGSVIVTLGAVKFTEGAIINTFYARIEPKSCTDLGLKMDPDTVLWWMSRSDAARQEITNPGREDLIPVLERFARWVDDPEARIWGNGSSFDNAMLEAAYKAARIRRPWKFSNDRCYRTVRALFPDVPLVRLGTHHNALDDARAQALTLMNIIVAKGLTLESVLPKPPQNASTGGDVTAPLLP
jgi:hypothetical protein